MVKNNLKISTLPKSHHNTTTSHKATFWNSCKTLKYLSCQSIPSPEYFLHVQPTKDVWQHIVNPVNFRYFLNIEDSLFSMICKINLLSGFWRAYFKFVYASFGRKLLHNRNKGHYYFKWLFLSNWGASKLST